MAPRPLRPRPQKRQNFQSSQRYRAPPRWPQQAVQMPSPALWNSQPNNQLNDMEMELEMMRRKRQMLQEKRQLLEEQAELERIQNQQQSSYSNMNPWAEPLPYKAGQTSEHQAKRGQKRAGSALNYGQAKRFAVDGSEKRPQQSMEYHATKDVGPVQLPTQTFLGADTASRSTLGRMELCLGQVLREMREQILEPRKISLNSSQLKTLKQRLRDRIHKMLMNKPVPDSAHIHTMYRGFHTAKGDERLISAVMEGRGTATPVKASGTATPVKASAPVKSEADTPSTPKQSPRVQSNKGKQKNQVNSQERNEYQEKVRAIKLKLRVLVEERMDDIFEKVVKLASDYAEGSTEPSDVTMEPAPADASAASTDAVAAPADAVAAPAEAVAASDDAPAAPADTSAASTDAPAAENVQNVAESNETPDVMIIDPKEEEIKFIETQVMRSLQYMLPKLLPRYKHHMVTILAHDPIFIDLGLKAPEKLPELKKTKIYERLYHLKVMSKPSLPDRAVMKEFLDQFNTISIKKHKAVYNLLFVGVASPEDQQRLLEHNGTIVGGKTLDIRISEKDKTSALPAAPSAENAENDQAKIKSDNPTDQTKDGQESNLNDAMSALDSEINDLFQCINDSTAPQEEGASENADETVEIADDEGLDADNVEGLDEDAENVRAETQNDASENRNEDADANGVVVIGDDDSQGEDTGVDEQKNKVAAETVQSNNEVEKSDDKATGIRTRRSSRIPQK